MYFLWVKLNCILYLKFSQTRRVLKLSSHGGKFKKTIPTPYNASRATAVTVGAAKAVTHITKKITVICSSSKKMGYVCKDYAYARRICKQYLILHTNSEDFSVEMLTPNLIGRACLFYHSNKLLNVESSRFRQDSIKIRLYLNPSEINLS